MELYQTGLTDPIAFMVGEFGDKFYAGITGNKKQAQYGGMFDTEFFQKFLDHFNCISITSGLPKNDYGQTVRLSRVDNPILDEMEWRFTPREEQSMPEIIKPTKMSGRYSYQRKEDVRGYALTVEEFFFFEFRPGYYPDTFLNLIDSLDLLRCLSSVLHKLDLFKVVLVEKGVYVCLRARIGNSYKPAFVMNH